jgi:hypothetical protein
MGRQMKTHAESLDQTDQAADFNKNGIGLGTESTDYQAHDQMGCELFYTQNTYCIKCHEENETDEST